MRRVIKNQKKMKDTMYIVFGVFALALFGITMWNPSYAEEWLIIDEALDAIMQWTEMYGSWGFEKVEEEKLIQPVEDDECEDADIVEFEITPVEEIEEWEGEDKENGEENKEVNVDEIVEDKEQTPEDKEEVESWDNNVEESNGVNNENTKIYDEKMNEETLILENLQDDQKGKELENDIPDPLQLQNNNFLTASSQDNPYIVYDEENWLITVYSQDLSYWITLQDKNLWAENVWDRWSFYKRWNNEPIPNNNTDSSKVSDNNAWWWGNDNNIEVNIIKWYDIINHKVTNLENNNRKWPCPDWYHIPSQWEASELIKLYYQSIWSWDILNVDENWLYSVYDSNLIESLFARDLKMPLVWYRKYWETTLDSVWQITRFWLSTPHSQYENFSYFLTVWKTQTTPKWWDWRAILNSLRCFKNDYIRHPKTVTFDANWWFFSWWATTEMHTYNYSWSEIVPIYNIQIPDRKSNDISQQSWWMFAWWYTKDWTTNEWWEEFNISNPNSTIAYAKWLPFNDLDLSIIWLTGVKIMDRNLWAENVASGTRILDWHEDYSKLWFYYQRWNNYWFKNSWDILYSWTNFVININYDKKPWWPNNYYYSNKYIKRNISQEICRWDYIDNRNLWWWENSTNSDLDKQWPCPKWYHVPDINEREEIINVANCWNDSNCLSITLKLPYLWNRNWRNSNIDKIGRDGYYWASSPSDYDKAYSIYFGTHINPHNPNYEHVYGMPLRCFKNSTNTNTLTISANNWTNDKIVTLRWREKIRPYIEKVEKKWSTFISRFYDNNYINEIKLDDKIKLDTTIFAKRLQHPQYTYNARGWKFITWDKYIWDVYILTSTNKINQITYDWITSSQYSYTYWTKIIEWATKLIVTLNKTDDYWNYHKIYLYDYEKSDTVIENDYIAAGKVWELEWIEILWDTVWFVVANQWPPANVVFTIEAYIWYEINDEIINPSREWYEFSWWYEWTTWVNNELIISDDPFDFTWREVTQDRTFYAKWNPHHYTIKFNTNEGNWVVNDIDATYWEKINLPIVTRDWYIFKWWKSEDWVIYKNIVPEWTWVTAEDWVTVTLTAQWEKIQESSWNTSSWWGWRKSTPAASEMNKPSENTAEIAIVNEHNSADEETDKSSNPEVGQVIAIDWWTQKTVAIKNTEIVATVRNTTHSSSSKFTKEENEAYSFAKSNWLTTTSSIEQAKMNTELTRIQMAKMLSNFAINVLWEEPDTEKWVVKFDDVTNKMDKQYDNALTKAYQLWIMWQNVKNNEFRPNDEVTRAEFASALSRLLYQTEEWEYKWTWKYYVPHVAKLYNEWIINKADPKIKEKRWYVMTMLKRTVE